MRRTVVLLALLAVLSSLASIRAEAPTTMPWTQLSVSTCGVDEYLRKFPDRDGRGVVIAVVDTGVDMGVAGLDRLPDGTPKVIDSQDFCGEGDIELTPAVWNERKDRIVRFARDGAPQEYTPPQAAANPPEEGTYWVGEFEESKFRNTSVPDVNDNGKKDDVFAVLVVRAANGTDDDALVYVDTDTDRDWSKDKPLRNYRVAQEAFTFPRPNKEKQLPLLTCAVNAFLKQRKVVIHFDDGGHGTHVAGIAAGYKINGQPGFNGVAPGAKVISLKIGNGAFSGGATTTGAKKRAFEYAARFAREKNVPVVCNLSYGVGSELEGHSDIDQFLARLCRENPNLIVCTSAGNNGPGLSSVGSPAAAGPVIAVAAMMGVDTARDVYGSAIPSATMATFSSRGGDLLKPDIACPGFATSTVPVWNRAGDFLQGTSMASPYAAGMSALLICDARADGFTGVIRSSSVKAALQRSAAPVPGFSPLDFGAGCPNMLKAAEALRPLVKSAAADPIFEYSITTESPYAPDGEGPAAYWRTRGFPTDRPQVFTIKPMFAPTADAEVRRTYAKRFALKSTAPWCKVEQEQIYFRAEQSADVRVRYDASALTQPGLYIGEVQMLDGDAVAARLWTTIIVPETFGPAERYHKTWKDQRVVGWTPQRIFVQVPNGASAMHLKLAAVEGKKSTAGLRGVFKPTGHAIRTRSMSLDTASGRNTAEYSVVRDLTPGIWELCATSRRPDEESFYDLTVRFDGVVASPATITSWSHGGGAIPSGEVTLINNFDLPLPVALSGTLEGYSKSETLKADPGKDAAKMSIAFSPEVRGVRIRCEMTEADYARVTDVAVNLYDGAGQALLKEGMENRLLLADAATPGSGSGELEFKAAFTHPDADTKIEFHVTVEYLLAKPVSIKVTRGDAPECTLYPALPTPLDFKLAAHAPKAPTGTQYCGAIRATGKADGGTTIEVPIEIGSSGYHGAHAKAEAPPVKTEPKK